MGLTKEKPESVFVKPSVKLATPLHEKTCLSMIKPWLKKQPHLPQDISDKELLQFLHCSEYSIEKTKQVIDSYYTLRTVTDFFHNREPAGKTFQDAIKYTVFFQFTNKTTRGDTILLYKVSDPNPAAFDYFDSTKYCFALLDILIDENDRQPGYIVIFDCEGASLSHLTKSLHYLSFIKKEIEYAQEGLPFNLREIHIINVMPFVDSVISVIKPFMYPEVLDVIFFYKPNEFHKLLDIIPLDIWPAEYGGKEPSGKEQTEAGYAKLLKAEKFLKMKEAQTVNEKLRLTPSKYAEEIGIQGSFRKLDLD